MFEEAKALPEPLVREALEFVLFLRDRSAGFYWMFAQEAALRQVWSDPEDDAWDNV